MDRVVFSGRTDRAILTDILRFTDSPIDDAHFTRLAAAYLHCLPECLRQKQGRVLPGAVELLDALQGPETFLGVITGNGQHGAQAKLAHFALGHRFDFGAYGDAHHERDDLARSALTALNLHLQQEIHPRDIWILGDTPYDVRCARAIGAKVLAVATGMHPLAELAEFQPDVLVADLCDTARLCEALR
jgi:phosphoglycolate phosphatase-like HAD superfamily hydrolase